MYLNLYFDYTSNRVNLQLYEQKALDVGRILDLETCERHIIEDGNAFILCKCYPVRRIIGIILLVYRQLLNLT